jgi:hypothetical protein
LSPAARAEAETQIKELEEAGIIRENRNALWGSPIIVIPKKRLGQDALTFRVVVDYRKVNSLTRERIFPMPDIESVIAALGEAYPGWFTNLD